MVHPKIILILLTTLAGVNSHAETNRPVVAVYNSDWGLGARDPGPKLIAALWPEGRVMWSATNSGAPYRQANIATEKLQALIGTLDRMGVFTNKTLTRPYFGPDSSFTTIAIEDGGRRLVMASWHELYEENTNLVATAAGIERLEGRNREQVLQSQPAEYRNYRRVWSEIRQAISAVVPETGEPYDGELHIPTPIFR